MQQVDGQTDDQQLYNRLATHLHRSSDVEEAPDGHGFRLRSLEGRSLAEPLYLRVTPGAFARHLRDGQGASAPAFPDVAPLEASWRLFLVHLDEAVQTAKPGETELVLDRTGVLSHRP